MPPSRHNTGATRGSGRAKQRRIHLPALDASDFDPSSDEDEAGEEEIVLCGQSGPNEEAGYDSQLGSDFDEAAAEAEPAAADEADEIADDVPTNGEMETDEDGANAATEIAAKEATQQQEADRKTAADAETTAYVLMDVESCSSERGVSLFVLHACWQHCTGALIAHANLQACMHGAQVSTNCPRRRTCMHAL
jgi:hypothetical protein